MLAKNVSRLLVPLFILVVGASLMLGGCGKTVSSSAKVVKIAFLGPLTGDAAAQGVGARNAFELAINQANASKKFPFQIQMVALDDASTPSTGASMAKQAVSDPDVVAASGFWNSPVAQAAIPIFKNAGVPLQIWGAIGPTLMSQDNYPYITRVCPTVPQQTGPLAKFAIDKVGIKKWAIISDTSVLGKSGTAGWSNEIASRPGTEVLSTDAIQPGTADYRPILTRIKTEQPGGIFLGLVTMDAALVTRQMNELQMNNIMIVSLSGVVEDAYITAATPEAAEGVIGASPGVPIEQMPGGQDFIAAYQKAGYAEPYGAYGPYAYDSANIILKALEQVGPSDKTKLSQAIASIDYNGLIGETSFDQTGQTKNVMITVMVVQDGKWVAYDKSKYANGSKIRGTE